MDVSDLYNISLYRVSGTMNESHKPWDNNDATIIQSVIKWLTSLEAFDQVKTKVHVISMPKIASINIYNMSINCVNTFLNDCNRQTIISGRLCTVQHVGMNYVNSTQTLNHLQGKTALNHGMQPCPYNNDVIVFRHRSHAINTELRSPTSVNCISAVIALHWSSIFGITHPILTRTPIVSLNGEISIFVQFAASGETDDNLIPGMIDKLSSRGTFQTFIAMGLLFEMVQHRMFYANGKILQLQEELSFKSTQRKRTREDEAVNQLTY